MGDDWEQTSLNGDPKHERTYPRGKVLLNNDHLRVEPCRTAMSLAMFSAVCKFSAISPNVKPGDWGTDS